MRSDRIEKVIAAEGVDAIKIRWYRNQKGSAFLVIGQPHLDQSKSMRITPTRARIIARELLKWAGTASSRAKGTTDDK